MIDLSYRDINNNKKDLQETANCYVIHETGEYCFPLVYGCGIKDGKTNTGSFTISFDPNPDLVTRGKEFEPVPFLDYKNKIIHGPEIKKYIKGTKIISRDSKLDFIKNIYVKNDYLYFSIDYVPSSGANYVIGILDKSDRIVWSWHIWLWKDKLEIDHVTPELEFLEKNLGTKILLKKEVSWVYQWGRKDPILPYLLNRRFISKESEVTTVGDGIQHPDIFYYSFENWLYDENNRNFCNYWNSNYWDIKVTKTIYDPCPREFTVPESDAFFWAARCVYQSYQFFPPQERFPMILDYNDNIFTISKDDNDVVGIKFIMGECRIPYNDYDNTLDIGLYLTAAKIFRNRVSSFALDYQNGQGFISAYHNLPGCIGGYIRPQKERQ